MILVEPYRQSDVSWGQLPLGDGTMASIGCFYTAVCSILYPHLRMNPAEFWELSRDNGLIGAEGGLTWWGLGRATEGKCFLTDFVNTTNHPGNVVKYDINVSLRRIERLLSLGQAVVGHVDAQLNDGSPDHAIVVYDRERDERGAITDLDIMDPITGKRHMFTERYGDPHQTLYGYRALAYPNATFPDWAFKRDIADAAPAYKAAVLRENLSGSLMGDAKTYAREIYDHLTAPRG